MGMLHLFSPRGDAALVRTVQLQPLLAFDFDGTLSPMVSRPEAARVAPALARRLAELAQQLPVAVVSGRSVADVAPRLGFVPQFIVGNHGAEGDLWLGGAALPEDSAGARALACARHLLMQQQDLLLGSGVTLEDKQHSFCLHYRQAPDPVQARRAVAQVLSLLGPELRLLGGRMGVNILARDAPDKADAVHALVQRSGTAAALYVGDDQNDEPVFARAPPGWLTVRIGRSRPPSAARFYLDSVREVAQLLARVQALLRA